MHQHAPHRSSQSYAGRKEIELPRWAFHELGKTSIRTHQYGKRESRCPPLPSRHTRCFHGQHSSTHADTDTYCSSQPALTHLLDPGLDAGLVTYVHPHRAHARRPPEGELSHQSVEPVHSSSRDRHLRGVRNVPGKAPRVFRHILKKIRKLLLHATCVPKGEQNRTCALGYRWLYKRRPAARGITLTYLLNLGALALSVLMSYPSSSSARQTWLIVVHTESTKRKVVRATHPV